MLAPHPDQKVKEKECNCTPFHVFTLIPYILFAEDFF